MTLLGEASNPGLSHMLRLAEQAGITRRDAQAILDQVSAAVSRWAALPIRPPFRPRAAGRLLPRLKQIGLESAEIRENRCPIFL